MDYAALQNGSDIRGVGHVGPKGEAVTLTDEASFAIGAAFGAWLAQQTGKSALRVGIGRDARLSGPRIQSAVASGLAHAGAKVFDCALCTTPAMFMTTVTEGFAYDGAIMVTASHLPPHRNGLKFFTRDGGLDKRDITDILREASQMTALPGEATACEAVDFMAVYARSLVDAIRNATREDTPLSGMRIVVDAGNGNGGFFVDKVLAPLGADTQGSQFLEPDGHFPNHMPNPEDEAAMRSLSQAVVQNRADLGIIFDTDVDRASAVDDHGEAIGRNRLIALMAAILLQEHPGTTIVTDSITSSGLKTFIEARGGIHHRFKRGYKNVINEAIRLNAAGQDCQLAIETSGHGALKENYFLDDGAYLVVKMLIMAARLRKEGKTLRELIHDLRMPQESAELRLPIRDADFAAAGNGVITALASHAKAMGWALAPDNYEGLRVAFSPDEGDGWFLLRLSLHDPLMPLNIESEREGGARIIARKVLDFLENQAALDITPLQSFVHGG